MESKTKDKGGYYIGRVDLRKIRPQTIDNFIQVLNSLGLQIM